MNPNESVMLQSARWLAFASSAVIVVGIAPSQILLGLSLLTLFLSREKLRLPAIKWTLALFLLGTLVAVLLSGNPAAGFPQVKKIYVFSQLLVAYSLLRDMQIARWLVMAWAVLGSISAIRGFVQFATKFYHAMALHRDFYAAYMGERITGFMSHWYTFSVLEMLVLIMLGAFIFFSPAARKLMWLWLLLGFFMAFGVVLAETRAVWVATALAALYLTWFWKKWVTALIPVLIAAALILGPHTLRERAESIVHPGRDDSNQFRTILDRTGVRMIEAHPWFGLGPEMPRKQFMNYLPADVPLPLPPGSYMHLHNLYLEYAAERGIPVLLLMLAMLGQIIWDYSRTLRALPKGLSDQRFLLHGGIAVVIAILVEGFADVNLGDSEVLTLFLVVVALGYLAVDQSPATVDSMHWFARLFSRRTFSISVDEAHTTFLYRERGRRLQVAGEAMADGYAVYSSSIREWETAPGKTAPKSMIDDAERQRIASNIRSYFVERGKTVYLS